MSQTYASVLSQPIPLSGQKNRSSEDFSFASLPSGNLTVTFSENPNADSILCTMLQDINLGTDKIIATLTQGQSLASELFEVGTNYYIASPQNAGSSTFLVTFSG